MAYDPVSDKLRRGVPAASAEILDAVERHEHLSLTELQEALAACETRFRAWVEQPENTGRPISDAPDYADRIALDTLIERRMWWE